MNFHRFRVKRSPHFLRGTEYFPLALAASTLFGEPITAEDHVLRRYRDRLAASRRENIIDRHHQHACLNLRFDRQRHVDRHLVSVEIGVERSANQRMQPNGLAFH
ncbi:MAG: hypothetical protein JW388_0073 [Nitrospira sp.]|nr:hypothetical protein [Nitrospira sp.]